MKDIIIDSTVALMYNYNKLELEKGNYIMKAIVLDMYGVIVKQTGDDFVPYVKRTFPDLKAEEIYTPWFKADV